MNSVIKRLFVICGAAAYCWLMCTLSVLAQTGNSTQAATSQPNVPPATSYRVVDLGPNHRVWQNETYEVGINGKTYTHVHKYTELASGLNYLKNGQWVESQEDIEPYPGGAVAQRGQYQVIFANNLNSEGGANFFL